MNYNKMYILITGGSGLIGEELISGFLEKKIRYILPAHQIKKV